MVTHSNDHVYFDFTSFFTNLKSMKKTKKINYFQLDVMKCLVYTQFIINRMENYSIKRNYPFWWRWRL